MGRPRFAKAVKAHLKKPPELTRQKAECAFNPFPQGNLRGRAADSSRADNSRLAKSAFRKREIYSCKAAFIAAQNCGRENIFFVPDQKKLISLDRIKKYSHPNKTTRLFTLTLCTIFTTPAQRKLSRPESRRKVRRVAAGG